MKRFSLPHLLIAATTLLVIIACQETWALAGVTGNIAGTITDSKGAPIAGVQVQAVAPSGSRTVTTDAGGHFTILSLGPDTYTISLTKSGYQSYSYPGVVVFADQTQQVAYRMTAALATIARVTSSAAASLVKSGVGSDLYNVTAAQAAAAQSLGGGGNLNNAYSALASVPGVQTSQGGMGWAFNAAYIRGQNQYYSAFEYDGIPVNRAFDNYNSSTESSAGLQELQVYTGGGPASVASAGTSGFINQVIKTGTFPGFATANLGIGTPQYYHQASVEIGGSTPDRTFSYYVALLGYNQDYRILDNTNGAGYMTPGGIFSGNTLGFPMGYGAVGNQVYGVGYMCIAVATCQGVKPMCQTAGSQGFSYPDQGCWQYYSGLSASPSMIADRESVINLHMAIPKANGLRDDVQVLWSGSALDNYFYNSLNDMGPGGNQFIYALYNTKAAAPTCGLETIAPGLRVNGCTSAGQIQALLNPNLLAYQRGIFGPGYVSRPPPYICPTDPIACAPTYLAYADNVAYNLPFGTPIATSATSIKAPGVYMAPNTPAHDFQGPIPANNEGLTSNQNDTGITKLQYTYALSQSAYLRAYGYTFYSDWLMQNASYGATDGETPTTLPAQYQLMTHTSGGALNFQDQISDQNLLSLDGNYTTAGVIRFSNNSAYANCLSGCSPIGYMARSAGGFTCYDPSSGAKQICLDAPNYYDTNLTGTTASGKLYNCSVKAVSECTVTPTWTSSAQAGPTGFGGPKNATWDSLWAGNATGSYNSISPRFTNASLSDQFRPNDRILINAAIRYDNFTYDLPNSATPANEFYANMTANYTCVLAATNETLVQPLAPGQAPPASAQYVDGNCNKAAAAINPAGPHTGWVHPNGTTQNGVAAPNFTAASPNSYSLNYWEPRFSATYTQSPDVVWRVSAGRFTQPPITASIQYTSLSGDDRSVWNNTMNLGFYSPFHPIPGISSGQYDLSYEQHFRGTDMSFKLTPFFTWVSNWQQQTYIGSGFVTQVPVGANRNQGVEFQFSKGDFTRNGLSGQLAFTYTDSKVQFQNVSTLTGGVITNQVVALNQVIAAYNSLTKSGGGHPCYQGLNGVSCSTKNASGQDTILNPYYNQPSQPLLNTGGWYNSFSTSIAPNLNALLGSYVSPIVSSLILNWRHDKLAITPTFSFQTGGYYGTPLDTNGLDPRSCQLNSAATGITKVSPKTNPLQCNVLYGTGNGLGQFGYLYIPDPQTGTFLFDNYQNPSSIVGNLQVAYDVNPTVRISLLGANLFHSCFGGTAAPWTSANPPSNVICGYSPAGGNFNTSLYPSNFYNGTGIGDRAANKAITPFTQSYQPSGLINAAIGGAPAPINVYINAQVKI
ncbi:MAG TPA: TonB-dependent receptor [Candidatus Acidoferrales bacterium]|jgi:hypothetical protein|nr:TonB-dependent receptor [Candidatus Acidoferrales bacterium]